MSRRCDADAGCEISVAFAVCIVEVDAFTTHGLDLGHVGPDGGKMVEVGCHDFE